MIDVVALLPAPHSSPRDLVRDVEHVESVGGDAATVELVGGNAEIAQLELLALAHEHVERRQVAVQRLPAMQRVEHGEDPGDLAPHETLRLWPLELEPGAQIAVHGEFHGQAIARARTVGDDEPVEHAQRARLAVEQLGEV